MSGPEEIVLEEGKRLSQCCLWQLQRTYYDRQGVSAWNTGTVPHYITNNPYIARAYLEVVTGLVRDLRREELIDPGLPVYLVELGAGAGRHAYYCARELQKMRELSPWAGLDVRYVLADFTRTNLSFWEEHERFQPLLEEGLVDFACFDVESQADLVLHRSGERLGEDGSNPVVFLANYLFDTLTQDVFRVRQGRLEECRARVIASGEPDPDDPDLLQRLTVRYDYRAVEGAAYESEEWNRVLDYYRHRMGDTVFCLPVGAFRCLENLSRLSGGRFMVLTADKAWNRLEELIGLEDPVPMLHGSSFSMTVNFDALGRLLAGVGGVALHSAPRESMLEISAFVQFGDGADLRETRTAFAEAIDGFGPFDFFNLKERFLAQPEPNLRQCLDLLRLSRWDPQLLYDLSGPLAEAVEKAPRLQQRETRLAVARVWETYYPIGESYDVPFEVARVLYRMEDYVGALRFYEHSLRLFGRHKMTLYNMGLCHFYLGDLKRALELFSDALEIDPGYSAARDWTLRVEQELHESGVYPAV
ncbi:MAG: tetratricopeptide repeat protein [Armatimonadetes bacterium]|nr:tetratricopeptide repeat protein [Armatimonadota bacterium]